MKRGGRADGYALLATLVVVALAGMIAATCVAAIAARQAIAGADHAASGARAAAREGLNNVCDQLRWAPHLHAGNNGAICEPTGHWTASWRLAEPPASGAPRLTLDVTSTAGESQTNLQAEVELRPEHCAQGVVITGDVELRAPISVGGSGLYSGGCLRGREWLRFSEGETVAAPAADTVHPDVWPVAGVHALGGIWVAGEEIHASGALPGTSEWASDSDTHTSQSGLAELTRALDPELLCALGEHAVPPGEALADGVLDLSRLPVRGPQAGSESADLAGYIVLVRPERDTQLLIVGERPAEACPVALIVDGDAYVGLPGSSLTFAQGALVVVGKLEMQGPTRYLGHIYAERLTVAAPTRFEVPSDWRQRPLPGLTAIVILSLSEP